MIFRYADVSAIIFAIAFLRLMLMPCFHMLPLSRLITPR